MTVSPAIVISSAVNFNVNVLAAGTVTALTTASNEYAIVQAYASGGFGATLTLKTNEPGGNFVTASSAAGAAVTGIYIGPGTTLDIVSSGGTGMIAITGVVFKNSA